MRVDERKIVIASVCFAVIGICILFFLSETPQKVTVAQAIISDENTLVVLEGTATNITAKKFLICDSLCISVQKNDLPASYLIKEGDYVVIRGRVKEYYKNKYIEAEKIEVG